MSAAIAKSTVGLLWKAVAKGARLLRSDHSGATPWQAGLLAVALTAATLALRLALGGPLEGQSALIIFIVPIMLSAYFGGLRAGLLATALSLLGASYYLLPPLQSFHVSASPQRWQQALLALVGTATSVFIELLHRARRHADILTREHREAEASIRKEREFIHAVVENVTDAIVSCDAQGVITLFNRATRELHGLPGEAIPAERWAERFDLYLPDGKTPMTKEEIPLFRALHEGSVHDAPMVIAPKGGPARRVLSRGQAFFDAGGVKMGAVVAMQDVTERAEAELAANRLSAIVESSQDAIIGKTLESTITSWNSGAEKIFGYTAAEMVGTSIVRLIPTDRLGEEDYILGRIGRGEHVKTFDTVRQRKDGRLIEVSVTASPIKDATGQVVGVSKIARDITERKRAEEAARRNQRHLRGLIDGLSPSMFVALLTPEGILVEINAAPLAAAGLQPEDVLGKPFVETHWWSSSAEARERLREAIVRAARGESSRYDVRTRGAGDEIIDIDFSLQPLRDESGRIEFLVPSASVITERTRAEELLAANQHRLRLLCDIMSKVEMTFPEKIAAMLRHSAAQLGMESGFLAHVEGGQYEMKYVVPETDNFFQGLVVPLQDTLCAAVLEREGPVAVEHTADSEWRLNPAYLKYKFEAYLGAPVQVDGRSAGILCFMSSQPRAGKFTPSDLEFLRLIAQWIGGEIERQNAEEALESNRLLLEKAVETNRLLLDNSLDVICTIDAAGQFTSLSAACEKLFGYTPAEMVGRPFLDFVLEEDRASTSVAAAQLPTGQVLHDYENRYVRKDGRVVTISWSATWSEADQSIFCVGRDCTERKQAADAEAGRLIAEHANVAKSEFLSRMSHELRTPMNAILGFAQVLESEDGLNSDQRDSVDHIIKGGGHLLKLINEVLDISAIESGRMTISSEAIALPCLIDETVTLVGRMSAASGIRLSVLPAEGVPAHVQADRQRLKQVLLNLIGNAIKYNRPGGEVTVRYHAVGESPAVIRISVTDTGDGLSPSKLSMLFHPFERLGAEQSQIEGTGLGLVLAKRMVEHMGGKIGVESTLGVGSTFWLELSAAEPPTELEEPGDTGTSGMPAEVSGEAKVVLYIEDNPANTRLVARILKRRPAIQLLCADTGARGLRMAREYRPDLILLDLHLPDSDGDAVLARLAAEPRTGAIPVVMLSANAMPEKRAALLAAGARGFMTKPLDVGNFLTLVDQFLA